MTSIAGINVEGPAGLAALQQSVDAFVDVASSHLRPKMMDMPQRRAMPLIAMPLIGTQGGGATMQRGEIIGAILSAAAAAAQRCGVDIVFVLNDSKGFVLAQSLRRGTCQWPGLTAGSHLMDRVHSLAEKARRGRLVPFMGAGVSMSAGAPSWKELISRLAAAVDLTPSEAQSLANNHRGAPDQAAFLRHAFATRKPNPEHADGGFTAAIVNAVLLPRYGLAPALLASLRSQQAITLNYDDLYERAYRDVGEDLTVIPGRSAEGTDNWLLKLHGSVEQPDSIVLTRDDYLGFSANREALSAIVKANLITHHIMFVGFGLVDDHFHQIIHDVRRALPADRQHADPHNPDSHNPDSHNANSAGREEFATALILREDPLDAVLWQGQLDLVNVGEPRVAQPAVDDQDGVQLLRNESTLVSARRLEIFLDALLAHSVDNHSYLLDERFVGGLNDADLRLRERIRLFAYLITGEEKKSSSAWPVVADMLRQLGQTEEEFERAEQEHYRE